jgi:hypothetical protein
VADARTDSRERYAAPVEKLRAERVGWLRHVRLLHLPARRPPWTERGLAPVGVRRIALQEDGDARIVFPG